MWISDYSQINLIAIACGRLIKRAFTPQELPSLIDEALSNEDGAETIRCLTIDDAQTLIDVIDEVRSTGTCRRKFVDSNRRWHVLLTRYWSRTTLSTGSKRSV